MYLRVSFGGLSILPGTGSWDVWAGGPSVIGALRWVAPVPHNEWAPGVSQNVVDLLFSECSKHSPVIREHVSSLEGDDRRVSWNLVRSLAKIMIFNDSRTKLFFSRRNIFVLKFWVGKIVMSIKKYFSSHKFGSLISDSKIVSLIKSFACQKPFFVRKNDIFNV